MILTIRDETGDLQVALDRRRLDDKSWEVRNLIDLGDLIGADGTVFRTRRGELSLKLDDWTLLAKSLRAPPDKFHGLEDVESRYRHRDVDLLANEDSRELFILRSKVVSALRQDAERLGARIAIYSGDVVAPREIFRGVVTGLEAEFQGALRLALPLILVAIVARSRPPSISPDTRRDGEPTQRRLRRPHRGPSVRDPCSDRRRSTCRAHAHRLSTYGRSGRRPSGTR